MLFVTVRPPQLSDDMPCGEAVRFFSHHCETTHLPLDGVSPSCTNAESAVPRGHVAAPLLLFCSSELRRLLHHELFVLYV